MPSLKHFTFLTTITLGLGALAFADTVVVSPGDMGSWSFVATDDNGAPCPTCGAGSMVPGPATPPLGIGSANLQTAANDGQFASSIVSTALNGVSLSSLTALSYSTYDTVNNGQQYPYLQLMVSYAGGTPVYGGNVDDILFFEPPYQTASTGNPSLPDQGATAPTTSPQWQTWNALEGGWWDNNGVCTGGTGVCSLSTLLTGLGVTDATVVADPNGNGGAQLTVGYTGPGDNFNANVDNVTFGISDVSNTTYDFEPGAATPEPGTFVLFTGAGLLVFAYSRRKAKIAKQTV